MRFFYIGCWSKRDLGHFVFNEKHQRQLYASFNDVKISMLDGFIHPGPQSQATLFHVRGLTVLTMGDYSADDRPGSNASFVADEILSFDKMLYTARQYFTDQLTRIETAAPITLTWGPLGEKP